MNSPVFRIAVLATMGAMGFWYWQDRQEHAEERAEAARVEAEGQRSRVGEQVHGTQERLEQSAAQVDQRTQDLQKQVEE
jgi:hypothetical protein